MNTADKLREYLRGERDWEPKDMARECLEALERAYYKGYADAVTDWPANHAERN